MYSKNVKAAFTLLEALITIAILASAILYFILAFTLSKYSTQLSKNRLMAANLLRKEMENVFGSNYSEIDQLAGTQDIAINDGSKTMVFRRTLKPNTEDTGLYGYKKVYVKIEWTGGASMEKTLKEEAVTYVTKQ